MGKKDKRIDVYISEAAVFAQPILTHLRQLVHTACPNVEETIKWGFPHFMYKDSILCGVASFKEHCAFGFWRSSLMKDPKKLLQAQREGGMGDLGKLKTLADLPSDKVLIDFVNQAVMLAEKGIKKPVVKKVSSRELEIPGYFKKALAKNKNANVTFEAFSYTNKKDYMEWITEAKTEETRNKRLNTSLEWLAEGKTRNWKYEKK
jgi:uncharacterized protein YdeI (YjbR/CyaY-like superfamily)